MYSIKKEFHFSASHQLNGLSSEHPCARLHGHNYIIVIELKTDILDNIGFVQDYRELGNIKQWIDNELDHRHLNDIFNFNPTAENMAKFIYEKFKPDYPLIASVSISETPKTWAKYEG